MKNNVYNFAIALLLSVGLPVWAEADTPNTQQIKLEDAMIYVARAELREQELDKKDPMFQITGKWAVTCLSQLLSIAEDKKIDSEKMGQLLKKCVEPSLTTGVYFMHYKKSIADGQNPEEADKNALDYAKVKTMQNMADLMQNMHKICTNPVAMEIIESTIRHATPNFEAGVTLMKDDVDRFCKDNER